MSRANNRTRLVATAYLEAGHAVAAQRLGITIKQATIEPGGAYLGAVEHANLNRLVYRSLQYGPVSPAIHDKIERHMVVSLAGGVAKRIHRVRATHGGSRVDREAVADFALSLCGSQAETEAYIMATGASDRPDTAALARG